MPCGDFHRSTVPPTYSCASYLQRHRLDTSRVRHCYLFVPIRRGRYRPQCLQSRPTKPKTPGALTSPNKARFPWTQRRRDLSGLHGDPEVRDLTKTGVRIFVAWDLTDPQNPTASSTSRSRVDRTIRSMSSRTCASTRNECPSSMLANFRAADRRSERAAGIVERPRRIPRWRARSIRRCGQSQRSPRPHREPFLRAR